MGLFGRFDPGKALATAVMGTDHFDRRAEAAAKHQEALQKSQQQAQISQMADQLGMDPRERLIFMADPAKWAQANASRLEAYTLGEGQERHAPGMDPIRNAKRSVGVDGGFGYVVGEDGTVNWGGQRPQSYGEQLDGQQFDWTKQYQGILADVARRNAGTSAFNAQTGRLSYQARKDSGGFGTPGVGAGGIWEEF